VANVGCHDLHRSNAEMMKQKKIMANVEIVADDIKALMVEAGRII